MSSVQLGALIARIFAFSLFIRGLMYLTTIPGIFIADTYISFMQIGNLILHFGLAGILWFKALKIGALLTNTTAKEDKEINIPSYATCLDLIFISFGILVTLYAIPSIASIIAYIGADGIIGDRPIRLNELWQDIIYTLFCLIVGCVLTLRSQGIRKLLLKLRNAGTGTNSKDE